MPTVYPCFYDNISGELLVCATSSNPSQRCPVGYDRVGNTTNCQKQITNVSTQTVQTTSPIIVATPRTGGNSDFGLAFVLFASAFFVVAVYKSFTSNPSS